ncbi:TPA: hypothetical protein N0F65_010449 [Lagenidium giganteum]|uniref:Spindle assembly abnormal protein 6 N-terminal domain-containing protein n=1 Tax=Lagenidium giganteum TaxID=4803 RepID=A0AAV2YSB6_9STRA|nr:TPA: hypothetical protein N0F65_010449 [Lagenidium giganteum]
MSLDGTPRSGMEHFDRDAPLFDKRLHVLVQHPDREEKLTPLTIRLLNGVRQNSATNQKERVFRVEITDDEGANPYFLYVWSVSEEEFHELKQQQRLLVDFAKFPSNLIELLKCCLKDSACQRSIDAEDGNSDEVSGHSGEDDDARSMESQLISGKARPKGPIPLSYLAVLNTADTSGHGIFSIVETNPFKHLTHLSLQFCPGDDAAIKSYLASRLAQTTAEKQAVTASLKKTSQELERATKHERQLQEQVDDATRANETAMAKAKMEFSEELNMHREKAASTLKQTEDAHNNKLDETVAKYEDEVASQNAVDGFSSTVSHGHYSQLRQLRAKLAESDAMVQRLSKEKYQHEIKIEQLTTQSKDLGSGNTTLAEQLQTMRQQNKELDQRVFQQDKMLNQAELKIAALQQQVLDKEEVLTKTTDLLESARTHKQEIEDSLRMYRDNHNQLQQKLELSIAEINKGNEIIERIQTESRALRMKMKMKSKIIKQQEHIIEEKQAQHSETLRQLKSAEADVKKRDEHILSLKDKVKDLSQKLEDSNKLLASNQQVITWLNKEINEAQISHQRRSSAHPSVYTFRPSTRLPEDSALVRPASTLGVSQPNLA